jgi:hypothetical protein
MSNITINLICILIILKYLLKNNFELIVDENKHRAKKRKREGKKREHQINYITHLVGHVDALSV